MHIGVESVHFVWDNSLTPVVEVAHGERVSLDLIDASGGQLTPSSTASDIASLDFARVNPVTGPIRVVGAKPGDALRIQIVELETGDWGWSALIPGFGLLAEDFPDPFLVHHEISGGIVQLAFGPKLPVRPMIGTIGVATPEQGQFSLIPPSRFGGNMDIRQVNADSALTLPIGVEGALLSAGDTHATMGDGEVCGTGVETTGHVVIEVAVEDGASPTAPILETSSEVHRSGRLLVTTGIAPDLMVAARDATRSMIDRLVRLTRFSPAESYVLLSLSADLVISEIVDAPNWIVSLQLPMSVLA